MTMTTHDTSLALINFLLLQSNSRQPIEDTWIPNVKFNGQSKWMMTLFCRQKSGGTGVIIHTQTDGRIIAPEMLLPEYFVVGSSFWDEPGMYRFFF